MRLIPLKPINRFRKFELNAMANAVLIFLFSLVITTACFALQPNPVSEIIANIYRNKIIFLYNSLPVFLSLVLFFLVTNNVFYSAAAVSTFWEMASIINKYKIVYRDDPFVPLDISIGAEAISIIAKTNMEIDLGPLLAVLLSALALIAAGFYIKSKSSNIVFRMTGALICISAALLLNQYIYKSPEIYYALPANGPRYHFASNFNSKGFIYCFLYNLNTYSIKVPENYSKQYAENLNKKHTSKEKRTPQKKPHIIMIMSEAFSDITMHGSIVFTSGNDPLKNFKKISEAGLSGHIIVPVFGGGTANTEYDVLTGCMTQSLSDTHTSSFRLVRKDFNAMPRFFSRNGYRTSFIHPGNGWFYNRSNVYKYFGIDSQTFIDKFVKPQDYKGSLVSDKAVIDKIIKMYKNHLAASKDRPLFNFTVTIQNHMPYRNYKYKYYKVEPVKTKVQISGKASELLSNYIAGLIYSDRSLGTLIDFLEQSDEPVVLVFFGDHMPYLGEDYLAYKELGYKINQTGSVEEITSIHSVPFAIWANAKAKTDINFAKSINSLGLPSDRIISANYLGSIIYELLGYKGVEPFYDFLCELRRSIPVITGSYYKTKSGYTMQLPEKLNLEMQDYRKWQYYKMSHEKVK